MKKLSDSTIKRIGILVNDNWTLDEIASELRISRWAAHKYSPRRKERQDERESFHS